MEATMNREDNSREDDLIDLGAASTETKGNGVIDLDGQGGQNFGLTDD